MMKTILNLIQNLAKAAIDYQNHKSQTIQAKV